MITATITSLKLELPKVGNVECQFTIRPGGVEVAFARGHGASAVVYDFAVFGDSLRVVSRAWRAGGNVEVETWADPLPGEPAPTTSSGDRP